MMSWKGFSQNDTIPKPIVLTKPVARLVIKDLVTGDAANRELKAMQKILTITNDKLLTQSDLVLNLKTQVLNYQRIIEQKEGQFKSQEEMNKELKTALKRERRTKKLYQIGSVIGAAAILSKLVQ